MMRVVDLKKIRGLVFKCPTTGEEYGSIRERHGDSKPEGFPASEWNPFAYDDCGNVFAVSEIGGIVFWDHETEEVRPLAESFEEFASHCSEPEEVKPEEEQVISVWVDPDFKPEFD